MTFSVKLIGFSDFARAITLFGPELQKNVESANLRIGLETRGKVRDVIRSGDFEKNAPLTAVIKGGSKALVGTKGANLFNSVTFDKIGWYGVVVGVQRTNGKWDVARIVHEGATVPVTAKMHGLFWALWLAGQGRLPVSKLTGRAKEIWDATKPSRRKRFLPLKLSTNALVIPPRPFFSATMADPGVREFAEEQWQQAVGLTIKKMKK